MLESYAIVLILGCIYGFFIGLVPVAGATVGLIAIYGFIGLFTDPYMLVVFTTAIVVTSSIGDSFAAVVMNIPGAGSAAATMVDGFPMTRRGESARALSAAISTSWVNGVFWGIAVFFFLPYYTKIVLYFGSIEMFTFLVFAMTCVIFISSKYFVRGAIALAAGVCVGHIGLDPDSGILRWTSVIPTITDGSLTWEPWIYLADGVQMIPVMAGVLAFPELLSAFRTRYETVKINADNIREQLWQGVKDSWRYRWDGARGGFIGAFVGLVPGIGGGIADWFAYSQTVAAPARKDDEIPVGKGNVRGVIGCEGANNAQKATSYVPTILFGIPGASFEVIIMGLFMYVGLELGTIDVLQDEKFFDVLLSSYLWSLFIILPVAYGFIRYAVYITNIPFAFYFWPILASLVWSSVQYTGMIEDYIVLGVCMIAGLVMKHLKFSRISFLIGFILSARIESSWIQFNTFGYGWQDIVFSPLPCLFAVLSIAALIWGLFYNKARIDFV
jgi:TctA family transporter